jgi:TRAP-type C4-dicarboxylate transport system permease small subunit
MPEDSLRSVKRSMKTMNTPRSKKKIRSSYESTGRDSSIGKAIISFVFSMNRVQAIISSFCVFIIMFLISADVMGRFFFGKPVMGTYEIGQTLMVFIVFFGLAYTQMTGGNVTVETFIRNFGPKARLALSIFVAVVGLLLFSLMTYSSWKLAWAAWENKRTIQGLLGLPLYPSKFTVSVGTATLSLYFLLDLIGKIVDFSRMQRRGNRDE